MPGKAKRPASDYGVEKRWTSTLAKRGFTPIVQSFLDNYSALQISSAEAMLIVQLMSFKWDEGAPFPAMGLLASRMRCSERYVRKLCTRLESFRYLERNR